MGVDIGVCKYDFERERRIERLKILSSLPGNEGLLYKAELDQIYDEIGEEYTKIVNECRDDENLGLIGARMFNLWYEIDTKTIKIEFSFYKKYSNFRVYPDELLSIVQDMEILLPISSMQERMKYMINFLQWVIKNNYMIYPN